MGNTETALLIWAMKFGVSAVLRAALTPNFIAGLSNAQIYPTREQCCLLSLGILLRTAYNSRGQYNVCSISWEISIHSGSTPL
jgi:hypothetical protein